ncbi:hypothetical protein BANRA_01831 [Klebsiella pneumoniae]|nr:hypothetical protein BANRA_01831 [Klebsiella pneumoniae]
MSKVADFVKRMEKQGRQFEVNGNFVVISPTNGLAMSDLIEMQNLNKKGELADYIAKQLRRGGQMNKRRYTNEKPRIEKKINTAAMKILIALMPRQYRREVWSRGEGMIYSNCMWYQTWKSSPLTIGGRQIAKRRLTFSTTG